MGAGVGDLQAFRDTAEEEPFAHDLPPFPVERRKAAAPSFRQRGEVQWRRFGLRLGQSWSNPES